MSTLSSKQAYEELKSDYEHILKQYRDLMRDNEALAKKHRETEDAYWQVWQDFHRVVYLFPEDTYPPLRRLREKYSELNVPWKERSFDARRDDALTETGTKPY